MRSRPLTVACVLLAGLAAGEAQVGGIIAEPATPLRPAWSEIKWPFPFDAWPAGRAFRCAPAVCGTEVSVYLRPKAGFCNCSTGVADDDEIDRVGDLVLLADSYSPLLPGEPITIGSMAGRARSFVIAGPRQPPRYALGVALAKKCDAVVAMIVSERALSPAIERAGIDLLRSSPIIAWAEASVGTQ